MAKDKLQKLADELEAVMDLKHAAEEALAPYKEKEEAVRAELLDALRKKGYKFVKTTSGLGFGITAGKTTFVVKEGMDEKALEYVKSEYPSALTINKATLNKILKPMLTLPEYFEAREGEPHLSVRGAEEE